MTGRGVGASCPADVAAQRRGEGPDAVVASDHDRPDVGPQCPVTSSKLPEVEICDRTRPVMSDWTRPASGHTSSPLCAATSAGLDAPNQCPVMK